jgi:hypothetical protein
MIDEIPFILVIVGRPKQGKSWMIKHLCYEGIGTGKFDEIFLFGGSVLSGAYNYLPEGNYGPYNRGVFQEILAWQKKCVEEGTAKTMLIIFDDVMNLTNEFKTDLFRKLVSEFRHYKVCLVFSVQYLKGVQPLIRECATHCAVFRTKNRLSLEALYDNFMYEMKNSKEVGQFLDKCTKEKYSFLLIDVNNDEDKKYSVCKSPQEDFTHKLEF